VQNIQLANTRRISSMAEEDIGTTDPSGRLKTRASAVLRAPRAVESVRHVLPDHQCPLVFNQERRPAGERDRSRDPVRVGHQAGMGQLHHLFEDQVAFRNGVGAEHRVGHTKRASVGRLGVDDRAHFGIQPVDRGVQAGRATRMLSGSQASAVARTRSGGSSSSRSCRRGVIRNCSAPSRAENEPAVVVNKRR